MESIPVTTRTGQQPGAYRRLKPVRAFPPAYTLHRKSHVLEVVPQPELLKLSACTSIPIRDCAKQLKRQTARFTSPNPTSCFPT